MLLSAPELRTIKFLFVALVFVTVLFHVSVWTPNKRILSEVIRREIDENGTEVEPIFRANVSAIGAVFPLDSRPPITLSSRFVIENQGLCSRYLSLTYVVVVHTAPSHFETRQSLRNTWARSGNFNGPKSQTIFLLGMTLNGTLQEVILSENEKHGDIVQGGFIDDYKNLTLKAVMGLKWITKNCPNADYVIKVDDDVFVNIFQVIKTVFPLLEANPKQVYCSVEPKSGIIRVNRKREGEEKWIVPDNFFKSLLNYPMPICYGYATFYTTTLAADLLQTAYSTPFLHLDDVYVYGILVSKTKGTSWRNGGKRYFADELDTLEQFLMAENSLVGTIRSAADMTRMWNSILAKNTG